MTGSRFRRAPFVVAVVLVLVIGAVLAVVLDVSGFVRRQTIEHTEKTFAAAGTTGSYRIYADGIDYSEPVTLVVRLHGDGAYEYDVPGYRLNELAVAAERNNAILVAPRTPDGWTETWWENSFDTLPWLQELMVKEVLPDVGLDSDDVLWMGFSGGAELLTRSLIPHTPQLATGAAVMVGGGGMPYNADDEVMADAAALVGPLYWVTGQLDNGTKPDQPWDAYSAVQVGVEYYGRFDFDIDADFPPDVDHFGVNQPELLDEVLQDFGRDAGRIVEPVELP